MASTPVTAAPPEANACSRRNRLIAPVVSATSSGIGAGWRSPRNDRTIPMPRSTNIIAMKKYVGVANSFPDSRIPRRFAQAIAQMKATAIGTRKAYELGATEVIAATRRRRRRRR